MNAATAAPVTTGMSRRQTPPSAEAIRASSLIRDPHRLREIPNVIVFEARVIRLVAMPVTATLAVQGEGERLHPFDVVMSGRDDGTDLHRRLAPFRDGTIAVVVGPREAGGVAVEYGGVIGLDVELDGIEFRRERAAVPGDATFRVRRVDGRDSATPLVMPLAADEIAMAAAYFTRPARLTLGTIAGA